ncbi:MAG: hypothetical protein J6T39_03190, partial [Clostridia bacterium]|nr:hypothetical protein [Clostridia bacterium]
GNYYSSEISPSIPGIANQVNAHEGAEGVYAKTTNELKTQAVYFSFEDNEGEKYWQFAEGVWTIDEGRNLPKLSYDVSYISSRVQNYTAKGEIRTYSDFVALASAKAGEQYTLAANIVIPEEYTPFAFEGLLTCPIVDGKPEFKITLTINSDSHVVEGIAALFTRLGSSAKLTNIEVNATISNVTDAHHVAVFAGINYGTIEKCYASGRVETLCSTGTVYVGGVVAENHGHVVNCNTSAKLYYTKSPTRFYVGGVAGFSANTIQNSRNTALIDVSGKSEVYVGGIAGYTSAEVSKCANQGEIKGEVEAQNTYFAGIAGKVENNINAKVINCANYGSIKGSNIGGVVGVSNGAVKYCYTNASLEGWRVGGIAYAVKQGTSGAPSIISNCMTDDSNLIAANTSSIVCGVAYQIDVSTSHLAYGENIFTSAKFLGNGDMYYETTSNIRGDSSDFFNQKGIIDTNAFNNCIHVARSSNIKRQRFVTDITHGWANITGQEDIEISESEARGTDGGYNVFASNGFNSSVWTYNAGTVGNYIALKNLPERV